jgi:hypothetical protein
MGAATARTGGCVDSFRTRTPVGLDAESAVAGVTHPAVHDWRGLFDAIAAGELRVSKGSTWQQGSSAGDASGCGMGQQGPSAMPAGCGQQHLPDGHCPDNATACATVPRTSRPAIVSDISKRYLFSMPTLIPRQLQKLHSNYPNLTATSSHLRRVSIKQAQRQGNIRPGWAGLAIGSAVGAARYCSLSGRLTGPFFREGGAPRCRPARFNAR